MRPSTASTESGTGAAPWWAELPVAMRSPEAADRLLRDYFAATAWYDHEGRSVADLGAVVVSHVQAGMRRLPGETLVRAVDSARAAEGRISVEVVVDDMPFLVDSLTAVLARPGQREIHSVVHPLLAAHRDPSGRLLRLHPLAEADPGATAEAWIRIDVDRPESPEASASLVAELRSVLDDVRSAVRDWQPMRATILEIAGELEGSRPQGVSPGELASAARFLRWLADDRFTFLGYADYDVESGERSTALGWDPGVRPVPQSTRRTLWVTKANRRATVHRSSYPDVVSVARYDEGGRVVGERRLVGLFTSGAASESVRRVPIVSEKVDEVLRRAGFARGSHSARDLLGALELFPREELLQADVEQILPTALAVLELRERRRTRLFLRRDVLGDFMSCLAFLPRDGYSTTVGAEVEQLLREALGGAAAETAPHVSDSALVRLHVVVRPQPGTALRDVDVVELERAVAQVVRTWEGNVLEVCRQRLGMVDGTALFRRWSHGLPATYRAGVAPELVIDDLVRADSVLTSTDADTADEVGEPASHAQEPQLAVHEDLQGEPSTWRLRLYRPTPATLSEVLPLIADLGVEVTDERPYLLTRTDGRRVWLYDVGLRVPGDFLPTGADSDEARSGFREAFAAAWSGRVESDALSRLVLAAQLPWRSVALLRALAQYLRQAGLPYTLDYIARTLVDQSSATRLLVRLFEARLAPEQRGGPVDPGPVEARVLEDLGRAIDAVDGRDADRILRALRSAVGAVLRTNYYQRRDDRPLEYLAFKIDPAQVLDLPDPRPMYEIWVHSPRVEGVHLRFGKVARGGLRWSDRLEDFRTEVLGLVKAQVVKNAVIVPTGAKGGFVAKRLPDPAVNRSAWWDEGVACYRMFISGILDLTDNLLLEGDQQTVVPPEDVVRHDDDDPYMVVAADKGTASLSDVANAIAEGRGFWLGDGFASGGSQGYDHKTMGITARGAWESVRRHFRELSIDPQTTDITVVGIGDMSGDVFGNGLLLSEHIRLVAAFDHRHIFLDPDPDPAISFGERSRLFALPRSSWADYDTALLSTGGGVFARTTKTIPLSSQAANRLGLPAGTSSIAPDDLVRAILRAPVDLLWNGGIGTYVKASTEQHADVGDKANDPVRVDATSLRVHVIGEGGNLGLTQLGRVEAARRGIKLNTDAVDNAAGVDCSDHEVNIKIMLDRLVAEGALEPDERNSTLLRMTDDVAELVLRNNYTQNRVLSDEGALAVEALSAHRRFIDALEESGAIDRQLEALPSSVELDRRARDGAGLTVPELAVLLAHAKISLARAVREGGLADETWVQDTLRGYFPAELGDRYAERLADHPLRGDIATTMLVNEIIDHGGITFAYRAVEESDTDPAQVVRAYAVASRAFGLHDLSAQVTALDGQVPALVQSQLRHQHQRLLDRAVRWLLHSRAGTIDVPTEVQRFAPAIEEYADEIPRLLHGQDLEYVQALANGFVAEGVPADHALRTASLLYVYPMLDIVEIAELTGRPVGEVATTWFLLSERYGFDALLTRVSALGRGDRWEVQARSALRVDLYDVLRRFTTTVLVDAATRPSTAPASDELSAVEAWEEIQPTAVARARRALDDVDSAGRSDLAVLAVVVRTLRTVLERA